MDSKKLNRWYKELSGFREKKESGELRKNDVIVPRANDSNKIIEVPVVQMKNYGKRIGIDEKHIKEEYSTILYNLETSKIIMIIKSVKSNEIYKAIQTHFSVNQQYEVEVVTKDCANNFDWLARQAFPNAIRIADKFHIMGMIYDCVQQVRKDIKNETIIEIEEAQKERYKQYEIDKHEAKKSKKSIDLKNYKITEIRQENGDTIVELLTRSRYLLYKPEEKWTSQQKQRAEILFYNFPIIKSIYYLIQKFRKWYSLENLFKPLKSLNTYFDNWIKELKGIKSKAVQALLITLKNQRGVIINYFLAGDTNAVAESINRQIEKLVGRSYGIRDIDFFMFRIEKYLT